MLICFVYCVFKIDIMILFFVFLSVFLKKIIFLEFLNYLRNMYKNVFDFNN